MNDIDTSSHGFLVKADQAKRSIFLIFDDPITWLDLDMTTARALAQLINDQLKEWERNAF